MELAVSQLQEALFGLNRRLLSERKADAGPLQGLRNTLGTLKDELFSDDDWDDWDRGPRSDPWDTAPRRRDDERWRDQGRRSQPESWSDLGAGGRVDRGVVDQTARPFARERADGRGDAWRDGGQEGWSAETPRPKAPSAPPARNRDLTSPEAWQPPSFAVDRGRPRGMPAPAADPWGDDPDP